MAESVKALPAYPMGATGVLRRKQVPQRCWVCHLTERVLLPCGRTMPRLINHGRPQCQQQPVSDAHMRNLSAHRDR